MVLSAAAKAKARAAKARAAAKKSTKITKVKPAAKKTTKGSTKAKVVAKKKPKQMKKPAVKKVPAKRVPLKQTAPKPIASKGVKNVYLLMELQEKYEVVGIFDTLAGAKKVVGDFSVANGSARNAHPAYVLKAKERVRDSKETLVIVPIKMNVLRFPYDQEYDDSDI
jgi:hypothetical protein